MMTDRLHIAMLLARRAARGLQRRLLAQTRIASRWRARPPERLLIAPQDIRTTDPTSAADIAAGYFAFGGKIVNAMGRSPFSLDPGSTLWMRQLAGFGWLRHLRRADDAAARSRGRVLVDDFLAAFGKPSPHLVWQPRIAGRRVLSWLSQSPIILEGADRDFYTRFMTALARHRIHLERQLASGLTGDDRLTVALALAEYSICVEDTPALQRRSTDALAAEIAAQVLPDGGHVSRNPQILLDLLLDLLPLRQAYAARGIQAPTQVLNAIDQILPMLRLFRHGDGTLALFNGMGPTAPELFATILAYDDVRAQPATNARYSGYQRVEHNGTLVIVDAGLPPPKAFSTHAHAGCLSFELSSGLRRLVVNCGTFEGARPSAKEAARTTAAHSTLVLDETSSCRFAAPEGVQRWLGEQILAGPTEVVADRSRGQGADLLAMSHDGYARRFGYNHHRTLTLADDGSRLDGHDELVASGKTSPSQADYALRFHLHPGVRARAAIDGSFVRLDLPDGETWRFDASAVMLVEPSILFAAAGGPRPTTQIVIAANTADAPSISWRFERLSTGSRDR